MDDVITEISSNLMASSIRAAKTMIFALYTIKVAKRVPSTIVIASLIGLESMWNKFEKKVNL